MTASSIQRCARGVLFSLVGGLGLLTAAQAGDRLNWSVTVGSAPVVMVPAPVVVARPVHVVTGVVVQGPSYVVPSGHHREHARGKGWKKKQAQGRGEVWHYHAGDAPGATVVLQSAPQVWVR